MAYKQLLNKPTEAVWPFEIGHKIPITSILSPGLAKSTKSSCTITSTDQPNKPIGTCSGVS